MFRKTTLLAGALALMLVAPQAHAAQGGWVIDFNAGTAIPMGDFKDFANLGFMGGVGAGYGVTDAVQVGVDGSFIMNKGSDDYNALLTQLPTAPVEAKFSMISGGAHLKYMFSTAEGSSMTPYVVVGAGLYNGKEKQESSDPLFNGESSDTKFGVRGGLGFGYKAGESVRVGLEGTFHHIATEGSSTQFVGLQAGVSVSMSQP